MKTAWQFYAEWATLIAIILGLVAGVFYLMRPSHMFVAFNVSANNLAVKD